jgi:hypothetical protein
MTISDEMLIAYADGKLGGDELHLVEAALKTRPDLRAVVDRQLTLRRRIDAAFAPTMSEEVPGHLLRMLAETPVSWRWRLSRTAAQTMQAVASRRFLLWSAGPAGAALACGILLGVFAAPENAFRLDGGAMMAQGSLASALDRQLASETVKSIRVGLSFRAKDGRYCRTFERGGTASALAGVACRDTDGWAVAALAATPPENSAYRMAGAMPDTVRSVVAQMIAGDPLDASAEKHARDAGWPSSNRTR